MTGVLTQKKQVILTSLLKSCPRSHAVRFLTACDFHFTISRDRHLILILFVTSTSGKLEKSVKTREKQLETEGTFFAKAAILANYKQRAEIEDKTV